MFDDLRDGLIHFLKHSHSSFHVVQQVKKALLSAGFEELREDRKWKLMKGQGYFVTRNSSAVLAFLLPQEDPESLHIIASHSDSPVFKIKPEPEMAGGGDTIRLNIEKYGGMLTAPWFDRPLTVAGRIIVQSGGRLEEKLVYVDRDLLIIPSLAIHMDRETNEKAHGNVQTEMLPLYGSREAAGTFMEMVAREAGVNREDILGADLYLTTRLDPSVWGKDGEYLSAERLDDLEGVYCTMRGFLAAAENPGMNAPGVVPMLVVFDNEEVGSRTRQGAESDFLSGNVERICGAFGKTREEQKILAANSFMISTDNAHAVHPNIPERADPVNRPRLNGGVVLKHHAGHKYTTDAVSGAVIRKLCLDHEIPLQVFTNRSDMTSGSTLGSISGTQIPLRTADIGLPQLAMHSCYETAGAKDPIYLARLAECYYREALPEIIEE